MAGYIVPSKLYGILAARRPYVAAVKDSSEVAAITRRHGLGDRRGPGARRASSPTPSSSSITTARLRGRWARAPGVLRWSSIARARWARTTSCSMV
jgi:hypothetical protein